MQCLWPERGPHTCVKRRRRKQINYVSSRAMNPPPEPTPIVEERLRHFDPAEINRRIEAGLNPPRLDSKQKISSLSAAAGWNSQNNAAKTKHS